MKPKPKKKRRARRKASGKLCHPMTGEPVSFETWKRAEIARIIDKGD